MKEGKVLIGFSLLWIIVWCIIGYVFIGATSGVYHLKMTELAQSGDLAQFWAMSNAWKAHTVAHSHALCFATMAFLVGLAMAIKVIVIPNNFRAVLILFFIMGTALVSIGDWFTIVLLVIPGGLMFIMALVMAFIGLILQPTKAG